jgi:hypothetical protein
MTESPGSDRAVSVAARTSIYIRVPLSFGGFKSVPTDLMYRRFPPSEERVK